MSRCVSVRLLAIQGVVKGLELATELVGGDQVNHRAGPGVGFSDLDRGGEEGVEHRVSLGS